MCTTDGSSTFLGGRVWRQCFSQGENDRWDLNNSELTFEYYLLDREFVPVTNFGQISSRELIVEPDLSDLHVIPNVYP